MEEPASGEEDRQGEVDGDKKQNGESHAGHDLAYPPIGGAPIDVRHDIHEGPKGRGGGKERHGEAREEHGVGLVIGDVEDIVPQDGTTLLGEKFLGPGEDQVHVQVQQPHKSIDADQHRKEAENEKIGQLRGGPGHPAVKIYLQDLAHKPHPSGFPQPPHLLACLSVLK